MREQILACLGDFPQKTTSDMKVEKIEDMGTYLRKSISYNVEVDERISAYLLEPKEKMSKMPGMLAIHQHNGQWHMGKSEVVGLSGKEMYHYGVDLVNRGYVVIVPDLLCFEDRIHPDFRDSNEKNSMYERLEFCKYIDEGSSLQTKYISDLTVAVDVLLSLEYVDENNVGVIGHSLGGQEATWMMWYDKRLKAGISSCGFSTHKSIHENHIPHNFALYVPGLLKICDMDEIVRQMAPRSFFMTNGLKDGLFPISGIEKIKEDAADEYNRRGIDDNFVSIIFDDEHKFRDHEKKVAYPWLDKRLKTLND